MLEHVGLQMNPFIVHVDPVLLAKCVKVSFRNEAMIQLCLYIYMVLHFLIKKLYFVIVSTDDFVIDNVVSSSELLSDISDSNVITFEDPHENPDEGVMELHNAYIAAGILAAALMALAVVVSV